MPTQQPQPIYVVLPPTNRFAVASLVLGIMWLCMIGSILAVIFGHVARNQVKRSGERGDGIAFAGLLLGYIGGGIGLVVWFSHPLRDAWEHLAPSFWLGRW